LIRDGKNGFFVERNVEDIADKLRRLRDDSGLRERVGQAARASVELWDWRRQIAHYQAMLWEVLGR
jgi:glycosyltransferase involved in cell wall biosynthesis